MSALELREVDRLDILLLVDNATDSLSTVPKYVVPEWPGLQNSGRLPALAGEAICHAHHGLSVLITAHVGDETRRLLLDAGPEGATVLRNSTILGADLGAVDAVVLSHGHWDHGGGLLAAVEAIARGPRGGVDCYLHPGMFAERAGRRQDGALLIQKRIPNAEQLGKAGARPVVTRDPQVVAEGVFGISGEIPRATSYEEGLPGHMRRAADGVGWDPDPLIMDERFVTVRVKGKGAFVFSSCSHAGIVNVLTHARDTFASGPLHGVLGGFHLSGVTEKIIPDTVRDLKRFDLTVLAPGHCTGWRAISAMAAAFGEELVPSAVGKRYLI